MNRIELATVLFLSLVALNVLAVGVGVFYTQIALGFVAGSVVTGIAVRKIMILTTQEALHDILSTMDDI